MPHVQIIPRDDLTPDDCRRFAGELQRLLPADAGGDRLALEDLQGGEPPRPMLLRVLDQTARIPFVAQRGHHGRVQLLREMLGDDADSRQFMVSIKAPAEDRQHWGELLAEALVGLAAKVTVIVER